MISYAPLCRYLVPACEAFLKLESKYTEVKQYVLKMMKYQLSFNPDLLRVLTRILTQFPLEQMSPVYSAVGNLTFPVHIVWVCPYLN